MHLDESERRSIHSASIHFADAITKTIEELHPQLKAKFDLTGRQLNVAVAKSLIILLVSCATCGAAADDATKDNVPDIVGELASQLEALVDNALGVEP